MQVYILSNQLVNPKYLLYIMYFDDRHFQFIIFFKLKETIEDP